ncbi:MAG: DNA internalization-related competence protein ComEC/Rec2 [Deltaproteobacteria bacterium]|nr:DNA internalization-related competence protein ComEC/Rec2 [Deltaproteobacteria bacterium]
MKPEAKRPAPLFRQYLLLAWCAGLFASRFFWPGFTAWALLFFLSLANPPLPSGRPGFQVPFALLLFFSLCFGLGLGYGQLRADKSAPREEWPAWTLAAVTPDSESELYKKGLRLRARVDEVHGLTDRWLQVILDQPAPADNPKNQSLHDNRPFPGKMVLTWYDSPTPEARQAPGAQSGAAWRGRAPLEPLPARPLPGQILEISLRPREVRGLQNPGLWEPESYWRDRGVRLRAWTSGSDGSPLLLRPAAGTGEASGPAAWREGLRQSLNATLPRLGPGHNPDAPVAPGADFIPALLLGDKYLQDSSTADLMARSTLAHSLALSGLHLGYVASLAYALVYAFFYFFPGLGLILPKRRLAVAAALLPALFYVWLGGGTPSLWRAWLMLFFWGLLLFMKRPAVLLDGLLWAVFCILLFTPQAAFDLRLQLSALSIAAIALIMPWLDALSLRLHDRIIALGPRSGPYSDPRSGRSAAWGTRQCARLARGALIMLGISFSAQLILMPLLARVFGLYGLAFPLNLLWLPLLGFLVMPVALFGCLAAALHLPALAEGAFHLASLPCAWLMDCLGRLDSAGLLPALLPTRPHWLFMLGYWLALAMLPWLAPRLLSRLAPRRRPAAAPRPPLLKPALFMLCGLLLCLAPTALRHYETGRDLVRLRLLDVGQGQAVLLEWQGGGRLLLDGGGGPSPRFDIGREIIAASLTDNRTPRLEFMLTSHPDLDHAGGLAFPLQHLEVGYFGDNGESSPALLDILQSKNQPRHSLQAGDALELAPNLQLEILWPFPEKALTGNNASLVARLVWHGQGLALLCGDVEAKAQRLLLERYSPAELTAQVLVLPHHGAAGASLPAFYDAVRPKLALASAGYGNRWFMPAARTRATLKERGIPLFSTDRLGQICLEWPGRAGRAGEARLKAAREP